MKSLSAVLLASLVFTSVVRAHSVCLNDIQKKDYAIARAELAEAKKDNPGCDRNWGPIACVSPLAAAILRSSEATVKNCVHDQLLSGATDGTWEVIARVCEKSGNPAQDKFVLGRDRMTLVMEKNLVKVDTTIAGIASRTVYQSEIFGKIAALTLVESTSSGMAKTAQMCIEMTAHPTLVITTSGFGPGGSCAVGEVLKTYFRKP